MIDFFRHTPCTVCILFLTESSILHSVQDMATQNTNTCPVCKDGWVEGKGLCRTCEYACTGATHLAFQADLETFKAATINHKPWVEPEYGVDMLQGDCPKCKSSLCFDLAEPELPVAVAREMAAAA